MPRPTEIHAIIEDAVAEVLAAATPRLRAEIVGRVMAEVESLAPAPGSSPVEVLSVAIRALQEATTQVEILRQLLEGGAQFAGRLALFVVRGNAISGWQASGFADNDFVKSATLNTGVGLVERALHGRELAAGSPRDFDSAFFASVEPPAEESCVVLPLVVKEKVAAVIYADAGAAPGGMLDSAALAVLTQWAALWLELSALRKAGGVAVEEPQTAAPAAAERSAVASSAAPVSAVNSSNSASTVSSVVGAANGDESELHRKARRFAKLLVEEIKLYNQPRVVEGKLNRDLYERLKVDIEKSRATYDKRYRETPVATANYFNQELVRILADNDLSLLGPGFPR